MSELNPTPRQARHDFYTMAHDRDLTDVALQGITRDGSGFVQALCLRHRQRRDKRQRSFQPFTKVTKAGRRLHGVRTVEIAADKTVKVYPSMMSSNVQDQLRSSGGVLHIMGTGREVATVAGHIARGHASLATLQKFTGPENGTTQLFGLIQFANLNHYNRERPIARVQLLADRHMPYNWGLEVGEIKHKVPVKDVYDSALSDIGGPGVARAIFNTRRNQLDDYAEQPFGVSIGANPAAGSNLEEIAAHLAVALKPEAIALRYIPRENPDATAVSQFIWNAA